MKKPYSKYMDDKTVRTLAKSIEAGEVQRTIEMVDTLILFYHENGFDIDEDDQEEEDEEDDDDSISISYGNESNASIKNKPTNQQPPKMPKFNEEKKYICEGVIPGEGLFKKDRPIKDYVYAKLGYSNGNANPPTDVQFWEASGRILSPYFDINEFKFGKWYQFHAGKRRIIEE
jgi:hypothetical protein